MPRRPHRPLSMLAHVELLTPKLEESVAFARDMLGMFVVHEEPGSVYLRCWFDFYAYSLVLTEAPQPGLGHSAWRAWSAEQLEVAAASVEAHGVQGEWIEASYGHGPAYRFTGPGGHANELFWEVDPAVAPAGEESRYPARPQRAASHGMRVRMLDHHTVFAPDIEQAAYWYRDALDFRVMEAVQAPGSPWFFCVITQNEKSHDLGFLRDPDGQSGRLHHVAFYVETTREVSEGALLLAEHGHHVDMGPGMHGAGEQEYLYFRDPAGLRYELNASGYRNYVPDWECVIESFDDGPNNMYLTDIGLPAAHHVPIPPGTVGRNEGLIVDGLVARG